MDENTKKVWGSWTTTTTPGVHVYTSKTTQDGLLGMTYPYYYDVYGKLVFDYDTVHKWAYVNIYGYTDQMAKENMNDAQIIEYTIVNIALISLIFHRYYIVSLKI